MITAHKNHNLFSYQNIQDILNLFVFLNESIFRAGPMDQK